MTPSDAFGQPHAPALRPDTCQAHATLTASAAPANVQAGITPLPPHTQTPRACPRCGVIAPPIVSAGSGPHALQSTCASCGRHLGWVSHYSPEERARRRQQAAMARLAPTEPQRAYLTALGDTQPPPANRAEASQRIDALLRKERGVA
jgi:hypothetical protein